MKALQVGRERRSDVARAVHISGSDINPAIEEIMQKFWNAAAAAVVIAGLMSAPEVHAGGKIAIDDTKWISLGLGGRASFKAQEDAAPSSDEWSKDFQIDNARIYINGQVHEKVKFELNTDCAFCGTSGSGAPHEEFVLLDAIAKFEFTPRFNIWAGRLLVPAERQELNGPFYSSTFDAYKTPFYSSDFSVDYGTGGAGVYARDHGINIWGAAGPEGALQYVFGVFAGLQGGPNQNDNPLIAGRVAYNFLNVEQNPGYYTSGTYYGGAGDVLTLAGAFQYQKNGAGSEANAGNFFGLSVDVLFEKDVSDLGVFTFNGEYKYFDADYSEAAFADGDNFGMFDGDSFSVTALQLLPGKVGIGQFQPYVRYTGVYANGSSNRDEVEAGVNYIIDGHNARVSLFYQHGDIATKGLDYSPDASGDAVDVIRLAVQIQI